MNTRQMLDGLQTSSCASVKAVAKAIVFGLGTGIVGGTSVAGSVGIVSNQVADLDQVSRAQNDIGCFSAGFIVGFLFGFFHSLRIQRAENQRQQELLSAPQELRHYRGV